MGDSGFYKGTSAEQDGRWGDKQKKFLKSMKFPTEFSQKCDMSKVNLEVIKAWIAKRITGLLGFEDEVLIEFVFSLLEEPNPDPRLLQINITGFLEDKAAGFVKELWKLLLSAQATVGGIPAPFLEEKKEELRRKRAQEEHIMTEIQRIKDRESAEALAKSGKPTPTVPMEPAKKRSRRLSLSPPPPHSSQHPNNYENSRKYDDDRSKRHHHHRPYDRDRNRHYQDRDYQGHNYQDRNHQEQDRTYYDNDRRERSEGHYRSRGHSRERRRSRDGERRR